MPQVAFIARDEAPTALPGAAPNARYMLSIITWPKPEHDTWVAPSIRRAKS